MRSAIGLLGTVDIAAIREQDTEIECRASVTARIRTRKPLLGLDQFVRFGESQAEAERRFGGFRLRCRQGISQGRSSEDWSVPLPKSRELPLNKQRDACRDLAETASDLIGWKRISHAMNGGEQLVR
jgi:hypothetical protein